MLYMYMVSFTLINAVFLSMSYTLAQLSPNHYGITYALMLKAPLDKQFGRPTIFFFEETDRRGLAVVSTGGIRALIPS